MFFEKRWASLSIDWQPGVREPRENRGRLRHCNGLQTPTATASLITDGAGRRERGFRPEVRISVWLCSSGLRVPESPVRVANFSVKEKDEASPSREFGAGFDDCLHSPICRG